MEMIEIVHYFSLIHHVHHSEGRKKRMVNLIVVGRHVHCPSICLCIQLKKSEIYVVSINVMMCMQSLSNNFTSPVSKTFIFDFNISLKTISRTNQISIRNSLIDDVDKLRISEQYSDANQEEMNPLNESHLTDDSFTSISLKEQ